MGNLKKIRGTAFIFIIIAILIVTAVFIAISLRVDLIESHIEETQFLNSLFVLEDQGRPFFTMALLYYPELKRSSLFDIPGNTGLILRSLGRVDRIDAVYEEKGMAAYAAEIESLLGGSIRIPFTFRMNIDQFASLADLLYGFKVFVPEPVDMVENGVRYLLPSGSVTLDGDKVKTYLTYPVAEGNEAELRERKQNIMIAFLQALARRSADLGKKDLFKSCFNLMTANISEENARKLFSHISSADAERLVPQTITGTQRDVDGKNLLFPFYDGQLIKDIVRQSVSGMVSSTGVAQARVYVIEIQNGTNTPGLARNTSALIAGFGYDILRTVNADRSDYANTLVIDHIGNNAAAAELAGIIRCSNIVTEEIAGEFQENPSASQVDFTVVLGKDFDGRYVR